MSREEITEAYGEWHKEDKIMAKYFLRKNLQVAQIFRPSKKYIFYKVTAKCGWLIKAERYYPNRKPQGRAYYGYTKLPLSPL